MAEYAERYPEELEPYYAKHVYAMTAENLHSKSDIAAELAYRDKQLKIYMDTLLKCRLVIEDFMPNIATSICVLQNYAQLNEALSESIKLINNSP